MTPGKPCCKITDVVIYAIVNGWKSRSPFLLSILITPWEVRAWHCGHCGGHHTIKHINTQRNPFKYVQGVPTPINNAVYREEEYCSIILCTHTLFRLVHPHWARWWHCPAFCDAIKSAEAVRRSLNVLPLHYREKGLCIAVFIRGVSLNL